MNVTSIKKVVRLHLLDSIKTMAMFVGCAFSIGFAIVMGVMLILKPSTYISIGSMFAVISSCVSVVFLGANSFSVQFPHEVKMSVSRTGALVGSGISSVLTALCAAAALLILSSFEGAILELLFGEFAHEVTFWDFSAFHFLGRVLLIQLALVLLLFILSAVIARFGRIGIFVAYFGFIGLMVSLPRISHYLDDSGKIFGIISSFPPFMMPIGIAFLVLGFTIWSARTLLTIDIR